MTSSDANPDPDARKDPGAERVQFLQGEEGVRIAYRKREGKGGVSGSEAGLFWLSGFKSDMDGNKARFLDDYAAREGLGYVRFDYRGHGSSGGNFEEAVLSDWLGDSLQVFDEVTSSPQVLVGSSMGGWLALLLALRRPDRVAGLVLIAPAPDFTRAMWEGFSEEVRSSLKAGTSYARPSQYDDEPYVITPGLIRDGQKHLLLDGTIGVTCPVRILHGMADPDVPWQRSLELVERLEGPDVAVNFLKSGDHRLSDAAGLKALEQALVSLT